MFRLTEDPINEMLLKKELSAAEAGGFVSFEGWIRNHNNNKDVIQLHYDAYIELAIHAGNTIMKKAFQKFSIINGLCVHRIGTLDIGEMAIWIGVCAAHRAAAFEACRFMIDTIKSEVPIWKNEFYKQHNNHWLANDSRHHQDNEKQYLHQHNERIVQWL